jgi:hypothetical protein
MRLFLRRARTLDICAYRRHRWDLDSSVVELEVELESQVTSLGSDVKVFEQIFVFTPFKYHLNWQICLRRISLLLFVGLVRRVRVFVFRLCF